MSLRALPLLIIPFIIYNIMALFGASASPAEYFATKLFTLPMLRGNSWVFTRGDLVVLLTMILLFIELIKATYTSSTSLLDHGLSMLVFIACLVEFLLVDRAFTSVFFLIMVATLIDVVAGYTIGIRVARRDIGFGGMEH